ncbi:MAG TPA: acyltransferase [Xanthomonadaceae bacterium]
MQDLRERDIPLGSLRSFLTLLVVLHHAVIAYCQFVPPPAHTLAEPPWLWTAFPIVDAHRWGLADLIAGFNDTFFMSLMFLIAGTFAWPSLVRKGAGGYLRDRARRLGLPFLVAAGVLAPLAYAASWLANVAPARGGSFLSQWLAIGAWPAGPAWFLWVLLAFGALAAIAYRMAPEVGAAFGRLIARLGQRPVFAWMLLVVAALLCYLPMTAWIDPMRWLSWGPFFVQASRVPHYLLYFVAGIGIGAAGHARGLLDPGGRLARRWWSWAILAAIAFLVLTGAAIASMSAAMHGHPNAGLAAFCNAMFALSCATTSFACIALCLRFARRSNAALDSLAANAYGIYLLHYPCVTWLQYALLRTDLPGAAKAALVFAGAVGASWSLTAAARRIPLVARWI